jgi:hypothetical protein
MSGRRRNVEVHGGVLLSRIRHRKWIVFTVPFLLALLTVGAISQLGSPPAHPAPGDWLGRYGRDGYALGGWRTTADLTSLRKATVTLASGNRWVWANQTSSGRALQSPSGGPREAATWYSDGKLVLQLRFTARYRGTISLYAIDWDHKGTREQLKVGSQSATLSTDFSRGEWRSFSVVANAGDTVTVTATATSHPPAVISGLFLGGGGPPSTAAPATTTPPPSASGMSDCFASPGSCGFPDPAQGNVGVPPGTALKRSSGLNITTPGAVVSKLDITGKVTIDAPGVTIEDSRVTWSSRTDAAIQVNAVNARIANTTITGEGSGKNSLEHAIYSRSSTTVGDHLDMENCAECWTGSGILLDSYARVNSNRPGEHLEAVYYGGGDASLIISHDTLLNPSVQTAVIFVSSDFGDVRKVSITDNLLAGGGAVIWGGTQCSTGTCGQVLGPVVVTGNRIARCLGAPVHDPASGGTACQTGPDSHGYWPDGGYLFPVTRFRQSVSTWADNVWDDNGATVPDCQSWYSC